MKYKILNKQYYHQGDFSIVPIRFEDRFDIMKWRNEQIYHLRQTKLLTRENQDHYFKNVVSKLFEQTEPEQLLFSYLEKNKCIGYGGLVHINWIDKNAEISFIINTELEKKSFKKHWMTFLALMEQVAFDELKLHKIYTYAFDLRPHLYEVLEESGFAREAVLKEHCFFNGTYKDVVIHSRLNQKIFLREITINDKNQTFLWANDPLTRKNSFNSQTITFKEHSAWFDRKLSDINSLYYICTFNDESAGFLRFDENENNIIVGITLDEKFRGKRLSSEFLKKGCLQIRHKKNKPIVALIKTSNIQSIKSFEAAGFIFSRQLKVNNIESYEYIFSDKG